MAQSIPVEPIRYGQHRLNLGRESHTVNAGYASNLSKFMPMSVPLHLPVIINEGNRGFGSINPNTFEANRLDYGDIKALLHFDYPYHGHPYSGLREEVRSTVWNKSHTDILFAGNELPNDLQNASVPKFGYRCPYFNSNKMITKPTSVDQRWEIDTTKSYEIEFFIKESSHESFSPGAFIQLLDNMGGRVIAAEVIYNGKIRITGSIFNGISSPNVYFLDSNSTSAIFSNFVHFLIRIHNKKVQLFFNGVLDSEKEITVDKIYNSHHTYIGGGNYRCFIDEFVFRSDIKNVIDPVVPTKPYNAEVKLDSLYGFGSGRDGNVTISPSGTDIEDKVINSYYAVKYISNEDKKTVTIHSNTYSILSPITGKVKPGDEVMIHVAYTTSLVQDENKNPLGRYAIRKVVSVDESPVEPIIVLDHPILNEFDVQAVNSNSNYRVQLITIPNYNNLTVESKVNLTPAKWDQNKQLGGLLAFKCRNKALIKGNLLSTGYGPKRIDRLHLVHNDMIHRFILTGNVFVCSKELEIHGHVGSDYDGNGKGGTAGIGSKNTNTNRPGGDGGVGLVGLGGDGGHNSKNKVGGKGSYPGFPGGDGYTHGAGGEVTGYGVQSNYSLSAPNVILIADTLKVKAGSISTGGGAGGSNFGGNGNSGGFENPSLRTQALSDYSGIGANIKGIPIANYAASINIPNGVSHPVQAGSGGCGYGGGGGGGGSCSGGWQWGTNPGLDDYGQGSGSGAGGSGTGFCFLAYNKSEILP